MSHRFSPPVYSTVDDLLINTPRQELIKVFPKPEFDRLNDLLWSKIDYDLTACTMRGNSTLRNFPIGWYTSWLG